MLSLKSGWESAIYSMQEAQGHYKAQCDKKSKPADYKMGDWVMIPIPHEESGRQWKLSRPWHGPYQIIQRNDPEITAVKVYFLDETQIQVHPTTVCFAPTQKLPPGFYWYGGFQSGFLGCSRVIRQTTILGDCIVQLWC